jgi:hypothetical protein
MSKIQYKIPVETKDYEECSELVRKNLAKIIEDCLKAGDNKIFIRTNLKRGLPLENINKVAGPFVEAWAVEKFENISDDKNNKYELVNVETGARLNLYDVLLQFKKKREDGSSVTTASVDVKATSEDIPNSGKSPNITSFARIRTVYVNDPDFMFIVLSLKHKVYGERDEETGMTNGIMEITSHSEYDLKYLSDKDISYNPALGTGQIQIRDIHYVTEEIRSAWEFCQILDRKFIKSQGEENWLRLAQKYEWIK